MTRRLSSAVLRAGAIAIRGTELGFDRDVPACPRGPCLVATFRPPHYSDEQSIYDDLADLERVDPTVAEIPITDVTEGTTVPSDEPHAENIATGAGVLLLGVVFSILAGLTRDAATQYSPETPGIATGLWVVSGAWSLLSIVGLLLGAFLFVVTVAIAARALVDRVFRGVADGLS